MRRMLFVFVTCLVAIAASANGPDTHLGQPASQLINLTGFCAKNGECSNHVFRQKADGTLALCPGRGADPYGCDYFVPDGMSLIITDIDWWVQGSKGESAVVFLSVMGENGGDPVYRAHARIDSDYNSLYASQEVHEHFTSGIVAGPKTKIVPQYINEAGSIHLWVRGYLVPNK